MRSTSLRPRLSLTAILLLVNVAVFLLQSVNAFYIRWPIDEYLELSTQGLRRGYLWQLFTFQFMHSGVLHLLCNCIAIYFFGRPMEDALGGAGFLKLYFLSGTIGGLFQMVGAWFFPVHFGGVVLANGTIMRGSVVGASAGAFGLVAAFAVMFPEQSLTLLLAFILPISLRAKYLLIFSGALALYGIVFPFDNIAHGAHLGGMLTGIAFIRWGVRADWHWLNWRSLRARARPRELVRASSSTRQGGWQRQKPTASVDLPPEEFISREVDPILDKISAHGIHSLTQRERAILEAARRKMSKR